MTLVMAFAGFAKLACATETAVQRRPFPGGIDEEDLRVQPQWNAPQRRLDQKILQEQVFKLTGRSEVSEDPTTDSSGHD